MKQDLLKCCHEVWRLGYKREKALAYCAKRLGYLPLEEEYVEHFKHMFINAFNK